IRSEGIRWKDKTVKACRARVVRVGDAIGTIAVNSPSLNSNFSSGLCSIQVRVVELGTRDGRKVWVAGQRTQRTRAIREFDLEIIGLAFGRHKSERICAVRRDVIRYQSHPDFVFTARIIGIKKRYQLNGLRSAQSINCGVAACTAHSSYDAARNGDLSVKDGIRG